MATAYEILGRIKEKWFTSASLEDFRLAEDGREVAYEDLWKQGFQPYCVSVEKRLVYFIKMPKEFRAEKAPFIYLEQYHHGTELAAVPWTELNKVLFKQGPAGRIFLYSVPRSGSTLLIQLLSASSSVYGLSEPDDFTNVSEILEDCPDVSREDVKGLLRFLTEFWASLAPTEAHHFAIKFRSRCFRLARLMKDLYPESRALFSYRNLTEVVLSGLDNFTEVAVKDDQLRAEVVTKVAEWLNGIQRYQRLRNQGVPLCAVKYEPLLQNFQDNIRVLFKNLNLSEGDLPRALRVLNSPSQKGTPIRYRQEGLPSNLIGRAQEVLEDAVFSKEPDLRELILPGTLTN